MAKHTAAPWIYSKDTSNIYSYDGFLIAEVQAHYIQNQKIQEANAALIASAPELLDALQAALLVIQDYLDYDHDGDPWSEDARLMGEMEINDYKRDGRLDAALTVISKATGQCLKGEE